MGWWMMPFGMVAIWVVWGLIVYAVYRQLSRPSTSPLTVLKSRYAKGEISHDEYVRLKKEIKED